MTKFKWMALFLVIFGCTEPKSGLCRLTVQSDLLPALQHFYTTNELSSAMCEQSSVEQFKTFCEKYKEDIVASDAVSITIDWKGERLIGSDVLHQWTKKDKCPN